MIAYDTVTEAINELKQRGYGIDFNIAFDKIICSENKTVLHLSQFEIVEMHRFEGNTNPEDEDVVYAIESSDGKLKGILMSAYGIYAADASTEMLKKIVIHH